jgi:hypothetical protein
MTPEQIKDFCMVNAGKLARGYDIHNYVLVKGRIVAFSAMFILVELENDRGTGFYPSTPDPLPEIPFVIGNWHYVVPTNKICALVRNIELVETDKTLSVRNQKIYRDLQIDLGEAVYKAAIVSADSALPDPGDEIKAIHTQIQALEELSFLAYKVVRLLKNDLPGATNG